MNIKYIRREGQPLISCNFAIPIGTKTAYKDTNVKFAHLIEHLLFHGHSNLSQYYLMNSLELFGAVVNAVTNDFSTILFMRIPSENMIPAIELLIDAIKNFDFEYSDYLLEVNNIRYEENMFKNNYEELFLDNSLKKYVGIKSVGKVAGCKLIREIYDQMYAPNKWSLIIVGDLSLDEYNKLNEKFSLDNNGLDIYNRVNYNSQIISKKEFYHYSKESANYFAYFHKCSDSTDRLKFKLVKNLLVSGLSSYFYDKLVVELNSCYCIGFRDFIWNEKFFVIFLQYNAISYNELKNIFNNVFSDMEFLKKLPDNQYVRAVNMTLTQMMLKNENTSSIANDYVDSYFDCGKLIPYDNDINILSKLNIDDVRAMIAETLF